MSGKRLVYKYLEFPQRDPKTGQLVSIYRPFIKVMFSFGHTLSRPFHALIDSGSDRNLLPASLGEMIGMKVKTGKSRTILGIGKANIVAYSHKVKLYIGGLDFDVTIDFSYEQEVLILGRKGFFISPPATPQTANSFLGRQDSVRSRELSSRRCRD